MYFITNEQIDYILSDIKLRGVTMEELQLDILDHVCCIIEQNLEEDGHFEIFYKHTIESFYKVQLAEIEKETKLLLTFKNYYAMKKTMIITGVIAVIAFILGSIFKILHWPGAGILLLSAIVIISLIFLPIMFIFKLREIKEVRDKLLLAMGTIVGILYFSSMLFILMHWPYAHLIWLTTLALTIFIFIPTFFFSGIRKAETKLNTILTTILLIAATGCQFTLTKLYPQKEEKTVIQKNNTTQQLVTKENVN